LINFCSRSERPQKLHDLPTGCYLLQIKAESKSDDDAVHKLCSQSALYKY